MDFSEQVPTHEKLTISFFSPEKLKRGEGHDALPEIFALKNYVENNPWHDHDNVFDHTIAVAEQVETCVHECPPAISEYLQQRLGKHTRKELLMISALLHDIAKPDTFYQEGKNTFCPDHEERGAEKVPVILSRFDLTTDEINHVALIVLNHGKPHGIMRPGNEKRAAELTQLATDLPSCYVELLLQGMADTAGCHLRTIDPSQFAARMQAYRETFAALHP